MAGSQPREGKSIQSKKREDVKIGELCIDLSRAELARASGRRWRRSEHTLIPSDMCYITPCTSFCTFSRFRDLGVYLIFIALRIVYCMFDCINLTRNEISKWWNIESFYCTDISGSNLF